MSDKSGNAEKVRDFLQKNFEVHQHLKDLQEEMELLNCLDADQARMFSTTMKTSYGHTICVKFEHYHAIISASLGKQEELMNESKKKLERMAVIVEEF